MLQSIRFVNYGLAYHRDAPFYAIASGKADVFLVCGGSQVNTLQPLCVVPFEGTIRIAIFANEYNNVISHASSYAVCADYIWRGTGIPTQQHWQIPPSNLQRWISELYLFGNGGDDAIGGMQDASTRNFIYGDYGGLPIQFAGPGFDLLKGGPGNDEIYGEGLDDLIYGFDGDDLLVGGAPGGCAETSRQHNKDFIFGGPGADTIYGDSGPNCGPAPCGTSSNPPVGLMRADDTLYGGTGEDYIAGGPGSDSLYGDYEPKPGISISAVLPPSGNPAFEDVLCGGPGRDWFFADDLDTVYYEADGEPSVQYDMFYWFHTVPTFIECELDEPCPR